MSAFKDLSHFSWEQRVDDWLGSVPANLVQPTRTVEQLLQSGPIPVGSKPAEFHKRPIEEVGFVRQRTLTDALFIREKALHCFLTARKLNDDGHSTWSGLIMYESAFFAAKCLIYLFGVREVGRSSDLYIEIFHRESTKKGNITIDGHRLINGRKNLGHESLWAIFTRLMATVKGERVPAMVSDFRKNDYGVFTRERNALLYGGTNWSRGDDESCGDLRLPLSYLDNHRYFVSAGAVGAEYVDKYYRTAQAVLNVTETFLSDVAKSVPVLREHLLSTASVPAVTHARFR